MSSLDPSSSAGLSRHALLARPTPLWLCLLLSAHVVALLLVFFWPSLWPVALALAVASHASLFVASVLPRGRWLGPNLRRLPVSAGRAVALTFDDGPDPEVTPEVLRILAAHGARATFFCIGERARACPETVRAIIEAGHYVENHSDRHLPWFAFMTPRAMRHEIANAQARLTQLTGRAPAYFRAPAGMRNPATGLVLAALELRLVSWTRRGFDTVTRDPARVLKRLLRNVAAGDILVLHDGASARGRDGQPVVLEVLPLLLQRLEAEDLHVAPIPPPARSALRAP
ncbi:MAG: polysaccharide deacetylase family protein [Gammaproteobacteria bacterium]|nr:polysaccharide deacetylase family protein [Gammaproteobacteria bacterium]